MSTPNPQTSSPSFLDKLSDGAAFVAGLAVLAVTLMITFDVLMRYFFNEPQQFADELASFLLILIIFGGLAQTYQRGGHIRVDLLTNQLSPKTGRVLLLCSLFLGIAFLTSISWNTLVSSFVAYRLERTSMVMFYPLWIPMLLIPIGVALMALVMGARLVKELRNKQNGVKGGPGKSTASAANE
jgi:TRAP-type C4-dicarboxylate transport system permease small subunit